MRLFVCGARGSTPAPGREFARHGGHTSCVAIAHDGHPPSLVLDAGTGIRRLTAVLDGAPFEGTILLGHLHWDHTQGLPFFAAGDRADASVRLYLPEQGDAESVLARALSPPHFAIDPRQLQGRWTFSGLAPGRHSFEGFEVVALDIPHKGGRTFGFRVTDGSATFAYLSDHSPLAKGPGPDGLGEYHPSAMALAAGADVLFHDGQHTAEEMPTKASLGHSAIGYAVGLAETAHVRRLVLFHHDPARTDDEIDALVLRHRTGSVIVEAAVEGATLEVRGRRPRGSQPMDGYSDGVAG